MMQKIGVRALILIVVIGGVIAYQLLTARATSFETMGDGTKTVVTSLTQGIHTCYFKVNQEVGYLSIDVENEDIEDGGSSWELFNASKKSEMQFPVTSKDAENSPSITPAVPENITWKLRCVEASDKEKEMYIKYTSCQNACYANISSSNEIIVYFKDGVAEEYITDLQQKIADHELVVSESVSYSPPAEESGAFIRFEVTTQEDADYEAVKQHIQGLDQQESNIEAISDAVVNEQGIKSYNQCTQQCDKDYGVDP